MKKLSKPEEIKLFTQLVNGEGYFAEYFGKEAAMMIQNINNDFPIELATRFNDFESEIEKLKVENKGLKINLGEEQEIVKKHNVKIKAYRTAIDYILTDIIESEKTGQPIDPYNRWEMKDIVREKLRQRVQLKQEEIDYLINKMQE